MTTQGSRVKQLQFFALTLLLPLLLLGGVYYRYVSQRTTYLIQHNFRLLNAVGSHIRDRIEFLDLALQNAFADQELREALDEAWRESFPEGPPLARGGLCKIFDQLSPAAQTDASANIPTLQEFKRNFLTRTIRFIPLMRDIKSLKMSVHGCATKASSTASASTPNSELYGPDLDVTEKREWIFRAAKRLTLLDNLILKLEVNVPLTSLLAPIATRLVSRSEFSEVLVFKSNHEQTHGGDVIFRYTARDSAASGLVVTQLADLLDTRPPDTNERTPFATPAAVVSDLTQSRLIPKKDLAGTSHQVFAQPLQLQLGSAASPDVNLVLCGLVRTDHFFLERLTVPHTAVLLFLSIILLIALGWPFLHVWTSGAKERLSSADVFFLIVSALLGSAILAVLLLDLYAVTRLRARMDAQLEQLADGMQTRFIEELTAVHQELKNRASRMVALLKNTCTRSQFSDSLTAGVSYPYFDLVSLMDDKGEQWVKSGLGVFPPPCINVWERSYVKDVVQGRPWSFTPSRGEPFEFILEPVNTWTTGDMRAIFAVPFPREGETWVAAMTFRPLSLMEPVAPAGFGYAIITDDGLVLFHSDGSRNLQEHFFHESSDTHLLRAAVHGHTSEWVDVHYGGRPHRLHIRPMSGVPWHLVVYRDKRALSTANLELVSVAALLFLLYTLLFALIVSVVALTGHRFQWLWPNPTRSRRYWGISASTLVFAPVMATTIFAVSPWSVVLSPFVGIFIIWLLRERRGQPLRTEARLALSRTRESGLFRWSYVLMLESLFLWLAVLPAIACFKVAYDTEIMLLVRHQQLKLALALKERVARAADNLLALNLPERDKENLFTQRTRLGDKGSLWGSSVPNLWDLYVPETRAWETQAPMIPTPPCQGDQLAGCEHERAVFSWAWIFSQLKPFYNEVSDGLRGVIDARAYDGVRAWLSTPSNVELRMAGYQKDKELHIVSPFPALELPDYKVWWLLPIVFLIVLCLFAYFIGRWALLLTVTDPPMVKSDEDELNKFLEDVAQRRHDVDASLLDIVRRECSANPALWEIGLTVLRKKNIAQFTPRQARELLLQKARPHYQALWSDCSEDELLSLVRLAQDHFLHAENPSIPKLLEKGLIRRDPALRLMNDTFAQFVRLAYRPEELRAWEERQPVSTWQTLRGPVLVVVIGIVIFLYGTQREVFTATLAFVTALTGALPALLRLLAELFQKEPTE